MVVPSVIDAETKVFVEDKADNWDKRRESPKSQQQKLQLLKDGNSNGLYSLENVKMDYRPKKQRIHARLWTKEIEKLKEAKLGESILGSAGEDDVEKLLDSCSEIFDCANNYLNNSKVLNSSEFKNKADGWETTSKTEEGNIWEMS